MALQKVIFVFVLSLLASAASGQVPELLYMRFNEGAGVTTADDSLVGLAGLNPTLVGPAGQVIWNTTDPKLGAACYRGPSSGSVRYWSFNTSAHLTGAWTCELWLRADATALIQPFSPLADLSSGGFNIRTANSTQGDAELDANDMGLVTSFGTFVFNNAFKPGIWTHLAIVCDRAEGTITPYIDGQAQPSLVAAGNTDISGTSAALFGTIKWFGDIDEVRIWDHARTAGQIAATLNSELFASSNDLIVSAVASPVYVPFSHAFPGNAELVTCEIENAGTNTIPVGTTIPVSFRVNGGPATSESLTLTGSLLPGDRIVHSFSATADISGLGPQVLNVAVNWGADLNPTNDIRERIIGGSTGFLVNAFPWIEDFEATPKKQKSLPAYWFQEPELVASVDLDWIGTEYSGSGGTTKPGYYATGAAAVIAGEIISTSMRSPVFDFRGLSHPRLRFWAKNDVQGSPFGIAGLFSLDVIEYPSGNETTAFFGPVGDLGPDWVELQIDLTSFSGTLVELRFKMDNSGTVPGSSAFLLDDLLVYDHQIGAGQPPQLGLAEFAINDSRNIGLNLASYGEPGPYFLSAAPGTTLDFEFRGLPLQPILVVYGPLNPVAATFPSIGQLDIGGPVDPMTGIPSSIQILFDGNQAGGLNGLFVTGATGEMTFSTPMPLLPPGILTTFQPVLRDPLTGFLAIANAVQLEVN